LGKPVLQEGEEVIRFNLGGFRRNSDDESRSPLAIPVDAQCKVESVREHFSAKSDQRVWKPHLEKVEEIIEKELRLIAESQKSKGELMEALLKLEKESQKEFQDAMSEWAKPKMKKAVQFTPAEAAHYKVTIKTDPKAASVYYLSEADYIIYKQMGFEDNYEMWKERWIEAANRDLLLGGNFRFRARWPGDKIKRTAKVVINKDSLIELAPE
jgi:hypothetical protein